MVFYIWFCQGTCPDGYFTYNCYHNHALNISYFYGCGVANWFSAEYLCRSRGGVLAVFRGQRELEDLIGYMVPQMDGTPPCDIYWIGFTRTVWVMISNDTDTVNNNALLKGESQKKQNTLLRNKNASNDLPAKMFL